MRLVPQNSHFPTAVSGIKPLISSFSIGTSNLSRAFAAQGAGIAMVEPFSARGFRVDELKVLPFRPAVHFELWIMTPVHRPQSQLVTALIEEFRSFVGTFRSRPSKKNSRGR